MSGISNYLENELLDAVLNADAYSAAAVYVKLHIGDPGEAGTGNPAAETTRKSASFAAASSGSCASDADLDWTSVAGSETYSHVSLWDHISAGNCLWKGALSATKTVNAGDNFKIPSGSLTVALD